MEWTSWTPFRDSFQAKPRGLGILASVSVRVDSARPVLFVAHPGHELLIHGWLRRARPAVCILTDGSGHSSSGRISLTREMLRSLTASEGPIFGTFADRDVYAAILGGDAGFFIALVAELADHLMARRATSVVADAAEGYNPVHDLCSVIAGAACDVARRAGVDVPHYEYAVVDGPASLTGETLVLDDDAFAAKMSAARAMASRLSDVDELLARHGEGAFRRETFRRVDDWIVDRSMASPRYEHFGEQRVAAGLYARVIRHDEHIVPLRNALRQWVESAQCVF